MRKYYVTYIRKSTNNDYSLVDYAFLVGDPDNMEETIVKWYEVLKNKDLTNIIIINWKVL